MADYVFYRRPARRQHPEPTPEQIEALLNFYLAVYAPALRAMSQR